MKAVIDYLQDFNAVTVILRLFLAMLFGGIRGIERGKQGRAAGMRTHILVCLGATVTTLIGQYCIEVLGYTSDPMRIAAQVVSGIGFLGVGTILIKGRFQITGLTTAAGIWTAAVIGLSLGIGFYLGAFAAFVCVVTTITVVHRLEYTINKKNRRFGIYVEVNSDMTVRSTIDYLSENFRVTDIQVTSPRSATVGNVGIEANVINRTCHITPHDVSAKMEELPQVVFAIESL